MEFIVVESQTAWTLFHRGKIVLVCKTRPVVSPETRMIPFSAWRDDYTSLQAFINSGFTVRSPLKLVTD